MEKDGTPNIDLQSTVGMLTSNWVNVINEEDDFLLSELIYWKQRGV
jgi:hypothetical protein